MDAEKESAGSVTRTSPYDAAKLAAPYQDGSLPRTTSAIHISLSSRGIVDHSFCFVCDQYVWDCDHLIEERTAAGRVPALPGSKFQIVRFMMATHVSPIAATDESLHCAIGHPCRPATARTDPSRRGCSGFPVACPVNSC